MQQKLNRETVLSILRKSVCEVVFIKKNGEFRKMKCTLNSDLLPDYDKEKAVNREVNESVVAVWDLEKEAWRSFRLSSLQALVEVNRGHG